MSQVHYGDDDGDAPGITYQAAASIPMTGDSDESPESKEKFEYDNNFHGTIEDRHCTDICMLLVFIIFVCILLAIFFYALTISNPKFLYIPTDYRNFTCGFDNRKLDIENASVLPDLTNQKYLFWARPGVNKDYVRSYCVETCPTKGLFFDAFMENMRDVNMTGGANNSECFFSNKTLRTVRGYKVEGTSQTENYYCGYATTMIMQRCIPTMDAVGDVSDINNTFESIKSNFTNILQTSALVDAVSDLMNTYYWIALSVVGALVVSLLWVLLMRYTAAFFVWFTVILAFGASGFLTYMCYAQMNNQFDNASKAEAYSFGLYSQELNKTVFTVFFWILVVWDVILFLMFIFLCSKIKLSVNIIKIVSIVFAQVPTLFVFPIIIYLIMFIWWIYVIGGAIVLFGAGKATAVKEDGVITAVQYTYDNVITGLSIVHFIGFIWVSIFINDLGEMALAGVFASWYFQREPRREKMGSSPVWASFKRTLRYHTGSIAFGSFIITIIKVIRVLIAYIQEKTKDTANDAVKCLIKCMACCFACLDKFMKFINRNCYVLIAIHGYNFFEGCKQAFFLIFRNAASVCTVNWVGDFTLFLGRVFVTFIVTAVSCWGFANMSNVKFYVVPGFIVAFMAFFASNAFTSLFEMGIDSMFLCYMEDQERNNGSPGHELFGPEELTKIALPKAKESEQV